MSHENDTDDSSQIPASDEGNQVPASDDDSEVPASDDQPTKDRSPTRIRRVLVLSVGLLGVLWGSRIAIQGLVLPRVEAELESTLGRDVDLGKVRALWPWRISVGPTDIEGMGTIREISVGANFWHLIWQRNLTVAVDLNRPELTLRQDNERGWNVLDLNLNREGSGSVPLSSLTLAIRNGTLTAVPLSGDRQVVDNLQGNATLYFLPETDRLSSANLRARINQAPLNVDSEFSLMTPSGRADVSGDRLPLATVSQLVPNLGLTLEDGTATVDLNADWQPEQPLALDGTAELRDAAVTIDGVPPTFSAIQADITIESEQVTIDDTATATVGDVPVELAGALRTGPIWIADPNRPLAPRIDLQAQVQPVTLPKVLSTFDLDIPVDVAGDAIAEVTVEGPLLTPRLNAQFESANAATIDRLRMPSYSGEVTLQPNSRGQWQLLLEGLTAQLATPSRPQSGQLTGRGRVILDPPLQGRVFFDVNDVDVAAIAAAYDGADLPFDLGQLDAEGRVIIAGQQTRIRSDWTATGGDITGSGKLALDGEQIAVPDSTFQIGEGTADITATLAPPEPGTFARPLQARIVTDNAAIGSVVPDERGTVTGEVELTGTTADLSPAGLTLEADLTLPQGIRQITSPITAQFAWDGEALDIEYLSTESGLTIAGRVPFDASTNTVGNLDLDISAQSLRIGTLMAAPIGGVVNLTGSLTGTPGQLSLDSSISLADLRTSGVRLPSLQGPIRWQEETGATINLQGPATTETAPASQLSAKLGPAWFPQQLVARWSDTDIQGRQVGDRFEVDLQQVPLAIASFAVPGRIGGTIDGQLVVNDWLAPNISANVSVSQPRWTAFTAKQFEGQLSFADNQLQMTNSALALENSLYRINGDLDLSDGAVGLQVATDNGSLADLRSAVYWEDWSDIAAGIQRPQRGPAAAVATLPISVQNRSLYERVEAHMAMRRYLKFQAASQVNPLLPDLTQLTGQFSSQVSVTGTVTDPDVQFQLDGQDWSLEDFQLDTVTTRGQYQNGQLAVNQLEAIAGDRQGSFSGTIGQTQTAGTLTIADFPIELLQRFVPQVPAFRGDLDVTAELRGRLSDPQLSGKAQLDNAAIEDRPLHAASSNVEYRNSQAELTGQIVPTPGAQPMVIAGTVPYKLPFSSVEPATDQIDLTVQTRDSGLQLVNVVTDALALQSVRGTLNAQVAGEIEQPELSGELQLDNATLQVAALTDSVESLSGLVRLRQNTVDVDNLAGQYAGGAVAVTGQLPLVERGPGSPPIEPLNLEIDNVAFEFESLYQGMVDGNVAIAGTALAPRIGGQLALSQATLRLDADLKSKDPNNVGVFRPVLNDLRVRLAEQFQVTSGNTLNFTTRGNLALSGPFDNLRPKGQLKLVDGSVNLWIETFRLNRGWPNTVTFNPQHGLDPRLNVQLAADIPESDVVVPSTSASTSRISESALTAGNTQLQSAGSAGFGGLQTVEVFATVNGRASELQITGVQSNILELTSIPERSQQQIVALLGGQALSVDGGILSDALIESLGIERSLAKGLGLNEVNFGTFSEDEQLQVGVEGVRDLGPVSVSVRQALTGGEGNTFGGLRYSIGDNVRLRTGVDTGGDATGSIEYEFRF